MTKESHNKGFPDTDSDYEHEDPQGELLWWVLNLAGLITVVAGFLIAGKEVLGG